jgi:hypothetical protein
MSTLADADGAFLLSVIAICLGACLVQALWEMEQVRERRIQRRKARRRHKSQAGTGSGFGKAGN